MPKDPTPKPSAKDKDKERVIPKKPTKTSGKAKDDLPSDDEIVGEIITATTTVLTSLRDKVRRAIDQKGGWEGWLQVELADHFETEDKPLLFDHEVYREIGVFRSAKSPTKTSSQRIDIWFTPPTSGGWPAVGVELKCASVGQKRNAESLATRFRADIAKCAGGAQFRAKALNKAEKVLFLCIGVTHDEADITGLKGKTELKGFSATEVKKLDMGSGKDARPLWVVWAWIVDGEEGDEGEGADEGEDDDS